MPRERFDVDDLVEVRKNGKVVTVGRVTRIASEHGPDTYAVQTLATPRARHYFGAEQLTRMHE